jgi:cinnamoyl-CoA reductase
VLLTNRTHLPFSVDPKNDHLRAFDGAVDRLVLLRADLMEPETLVAAFTGCEGIFHAASPLTDDPVRSINAPLDSSWI